MEKFDMQAVEKTFLNARTGQLHEGVVVIKRDDGVIFNIGGKRDAFISKDDFKDFENIKIGDRFQVTIIKNCNDEGLIEASKSKADSISLEMQNAQKLKLGSVFTFVPIEAKKGLISKIGDYNIYVPKEEVSPNFVDIRSLIGKQQEAIVTDINRENREIIASIKLLKDQIREKNEKLFWNSIFINKIVKGTVKKILPYGAFVDVDGVDCFVHISDLSYEKQDDIKSILKEGETKTFKVIEVDREAKKIKLGLKQLLPNPIEQKYSQLNIGEEVEGEVVKLLPFGAIIKLSNGLTGLVHISNITERSDASIHEFVHLGDIVKVSVLNKDPANKKLSLKYIEKIK